PLLPRSRTSILFYHPLYASLVENVNKKARAECSAQAFLFCVSTHLVEFRCFERNQNRSTLGTVRRADNAILFHLLNDASCPVVTEAQVALKHARGCGALAPHHVEGLLHQRLILALVVRAAAPATIRSLAGTWQVKPFPV